MKGATTGIVSNEKKCDDSDDSGKFPQARETSVNFEGVS